MGFDGRRKGILPTPGPYLAEVTNHLDPTYMGRLEVALLKGIPNKPDVKGQTYVVKYMSPFYGVTSARHEGNNSGDFNDVQKSYGMWAIPPDIGTTVMVIFIDGDPNEGYWMGCVQDKFQNHMVPGIAASDLVAMTPEQRKRYGTDYLPVAEFNKKTQKLQNPNPEKIPRPVHPFADRLLAQGLLLDRIRGVTSSSARRDVPSSVFGISTPGPLDKSGKKGKIGYAGGVQAPVSRLGGSTFVMDDGDVNGQNELVRIRTRTGHQVLLHNSADLIYIANAKGTAWIELTSNGKIDMYAEDSVSIHTTNDFNLKADRDFNIEAGRNINMSASSGDWHADVGSNFIVNAGATGVMTFLSSLDVSAGTALKVTASGALHLKGANLYAGATGDTHVSGTNLFVAGSGDLNLRGGGNILATGGKIHLNGPGAGSATAPTNATFATGLNLYTLPNRTGGGWGGGNFNKAGDIVSIMQRVPTHEPWDQHESTDPSKYTPELTSSAIEPGGTAGNGAVIPSRPSANTPFPTKNGPAIDNGRVWYKPVPWTTDQPFLDKVKEIAGRLSFDPLDLIGCMFLESVGTMDPAIKNPKSSATGLIQFMEDTATKTLGTTTAALAQMTRLQQLDYVEQYFKKAGWPNKKCPAPTLSNVYLTIFLPIHKFSTEDTVVASLNGTAKEQEYYKSNDGFDRADATGKKKGYFTVGMISEVAYQKKSQALQVLANNKIGNDLKPAA